MLTAMSLSAAPSPTVSPTISDETSADDALMARVVEGDARAYSLLVDRYLPRVVAMARRVVLRQAEAEEIAQDVFLTVWQKPALFNANRGKFSTWLMRMTLNRAIDQTRKVRPLQLADDYDAPDSSATAHEQLEQAEDHAALWAAMAHLPARQRAALVLCYQDDMPDTDGAATLGVSRKAYESLLVRGRKALRTLLMTDQKEAP